LLIGPDGVALTRIISVSASCYPPLHHKVQKKKSSGTGSPGWSWKKGHKTVVVVVVNKSLLHSGFPQTWKTWNCQGIL